MHQKHAGVLRRPIGHGGTFGMPRRIKQKIDLDLRPGHDEFGPTTPSTPAQGTIRRPSRNIGLHVQHECLLVMTKVPQIIPQDPLDQVLLSMCVECGAATALARERSTPIHFTGTAAHHQVLIQQYIGLQNDSIMCG